MRAAPKIYAKDKQTFARLRSLKKHELLKLPVSAVPFCVRAQNIFAKIGIQTLADLVERTKFDLLKMQGMGRLSVDQVELCLSELELALKREAVPEAKAPEAEVEVAAPTEDGGKAEAPEEDGATGPNLRALMAEAQKATAEALKLNERMISLIERMAASGAP